MHPYESGLKILHKKLQDLKMTSTPIDAIKSLCVSGEGSCGTAGADLQEVPEILPRKERRQGGPKQRKRNDFFFPGSKIAN